MHVTLRLALVAAVVAAVACDPGVGSRLSRAKQPRATRGFKNSEMMTARGFGKRTYNAPRGETYGLEGVREALERPRERAQDSADLQPFDSIPLEWFVEEMLSQPEFARTVVRKFVDTDQDGVLSLDELLRNVV